MQNNYLFTNANIVIDSHKIIANGSIAFNECIIDSYYHLKDKVLKEYDKRIVNLHGLTILPSFINISDKSSYYLAKDGVSAYISLDTNNNDSKYAKFLGYYLEDDISDKSLMSDYQLSSKLIKVLNKSDLYYDDLINEKIDVIYDLFHHKTGFDAYHKGVINLAFTKKYYVIIVIDEVDDEALKFTIDNLDIDKTIITAANMLYACRRLKSIGYDLNDIVKLTSINLYRLLNMKSCGGLIKGKPSDFIIVDDDFNLKAHIIGGKLLKWIL